MYKFLQVVDYEQTLDNSLIRKVLEWEPELTIWETLDRIIDDFKLEQAEKLRKQRPNKKYFTTRVNNFV